MDKSVIHKAKKSMVDLLNDLNRTTRLDDKLTEGDTVQLNDIKIEKNGITFAVFQYADWRFYVFDNYDDNERISNAKSKLQKEDMRLRMEGFVHGMYAYLLASKKNETPR